jgi:hypothetical protein
VAGHGAIVRAVGDQGGNGTALGSEFALLQSLLCSMLTVES